MTQFKNPYEAFQFVNNLWKTHPDIMNLKHNWPQSLDSEDGLSKQVTEAIDRGQHVMLLYFLDPTNIHVIAKIPMPTAISIDLSNTQ